MEDLGRKVVTLYGERVIAKDLKEDSDKMEAAYANMNGNIMHFANMVTVHSVSVAPLMLPEGFGIRMWLFATVVYSGDIDVADFFGVEKIPMDSIRM